jgi:multiple sugar transport system substrate-binding protein
MKKITAFSLVFALLFCWHIAAQAQEPEVVKVWHLWTGAMADAMDELADDFNASQDRYRVETLSVPDFQKITVAISSGDGPDLTDSWNSYVTQFADMGAMEPLDSYIEADGYDLSDFNQAALDACRYNGKQYAMPCNMNLVALYYNKELLSAAGYDTPPATYSEMIEIARATTALNEDGTLATLGFPAWPLNNYRDNMLYAFGGNWIDAETLQPSADAPGNLLMLQAFYDYVSEFGANNVSVFTSSGKTNDPTDPFLSGKQALRIDGPWTSGYFEPLGLDVDWGITYLPTPDDQPELKGRQPISCSTLYIPSTAKCKQGAWEFMKYLLSDEGQTRLFISNQNLPARMSLYQSEAYRSSLSVADFFAEMAANENLVGMPNYTESTEYTTAINEEIELCFNLEQTPEKTIENIAQIADEIF